MKEQKIFAGPRIKRIRKRLELSQTAMAKGLDISPSYLNLIEGNQRPLTVPLILKLSKIYQVSPEELYGDADGTVSALKTVFSDSLLKDELPGYEELFEVADIAPNVANGIQKLHKGYRQALDRLSEMNVMMSQDIYASRLMNDNSPHDLVRSAMEDRPNYFDNLDRGAENLVTSMNYKQGLWSCMQAWLLENHRITVQTVPVEVMPEWRKRYDKHSLRLFISERLSLQARLHELCTEVALLALSDQIDSAVLRLNLKSDPAKKIARWEMARYGARAMMMPYRKFFQTAERMKYDLEGLIGRFDVSFEQLALRLTNLSREGMEAIPFSVLEVDPSGNKITRLGADGFERMSFGGACSKLNIYSTWSQPNKLLYDVVEMIRGERFLILSKSQTMQAGEFQGISRPRSIMLICAAKHIERTIYAGYISKNIQKIGVNCRLCEIPHCAHRAEAPIARPLALVESERSISDFNFKT